MTKTYTNYFYGKPAKTITSPLECTIARGSPGKPTNFGKGVLVEANNAYDINSTEMDADKLKKDTEELVALHRSPAYSCFNPDQSMKLDPYWQKNTVLRVSGVDMGTAGASFLSKPVTTSLVNFSEPIFRLSGMDETTRFDAGSPLDCSNGGKQYALLSPYTYRYGIINYSGESEYIDACTAGWPEEWNLSSGICSKDI